MKAEQAKVIREAFEIVDTDSDGGSVTAENELEGLHGKAEAGEMGSLIVSDSDRVDRAQFNELLRTNRRLMTLLTIIVVLLFSGFVYMMTFDIETVEHQENSPRSDPTRAKNTVTNAPDPGYASNNDEDYANETTESTKSKPAVSKSPIANDTGEEENATNSGFSTTELEDADAAGLATDGTSTAAETKLQHSEDAHGTKLDEALLSLIPAYILDVDAVTTKACFPIHDSTDDNLALHKETSQSSISYAGKSSRAVDGNRNGHFGTNSVSSTDIEQQPWWEVDLGGVFDVGSVLIFNRKDCCPERLSNFHVEILDEKKVVVEEMFKSGQGDALTFISIPGTGRYVKVELEGDDAQLSLAEVEVYAPSKHDDFNDCLRAHNIDVEDVVTDAMNSIATIPIPDDEVEKAIQSDTENTTTGDQKSLDADKDDTAASTDRDDNNNPDVNEDDTAASTDRDDNNNPNVNEDDTASSDSYILDIEIPVFRECFAKDGSFGDNLALKKAATQSSISWNGVPERAVDGNRDPNYHTNSVTATDMEQMPWWQVDLGDPYNIGTILIFNREDQVPERLSNFHVELMLEEDEVIHELYKSGMASPVTYFSFPAGSKGRYIKVTLDAENILSLAEVEVYLPGKNDEIEKRKIYNCVHSHD